MWIADNWTDYECLDASDGDKLERWGNYTLRRPDPQVIWKKKAAPDRWAAANGVYHRSRSGGGRWEFPSRLPEKWTVGYRDLTFAVRPTGFKHTGLFPEQAVNWDYMREKLAGKKGARVLNLFAYTGGATLACAAEGARVVHVDASKGMVAQAKENAALSGLGNAPVRYIVDDCVKFIEREIRRGNQYEGIVMDPPSYGRGPGGEVWKLEEALFDFLSRCALLLSDEPLFFIVNSYTAGLSPTVIENIMRQTLGRGTVRADEVGLPISAADMLLPCGATGRWEPEKPLIKSLPAP